VYTNFQLSDLVGVSRVSVSTLFLFEKPQFLLVNDTMLLSVSIITFKITLGDDKSVLESVRTMRVELLASYVFFVIPTFNVGKRGTQ
jgi:hypothetical protein